MSAITNNGKSPLNSIEEDFLIGNNGDLPIGNEGDPLLEVPKKIRQIAQEEAELFFGRQPEIEQETFVAKTVETMFASEVETVSKMGEKACEEIEQKYLMRNTCLSESIRVNNLIRHLNFINNTYIQVFCGLEKVEKAEKIMVDPDKVKPLDEAFKPCLDRLIKYAQEIAEDNTLQGKDAMDKLKDLFSKSNKPLTENIITFLKDVCDRVYS